MSGFPERLKKVRNDLELTQEQLADELNVTKASISAWENGREAPRFSLLPKLRAVLGVSLDYLICGDEEAGVADPAGTFGAEVRSDAEAQLLKRYRKLSASRRKGLMALVD